MEAAALGGRTGLGDATPSDLQTIKTLTAVLFAYGAAMAAGDWTRASMCLSAFQAFWTHVGHEGAKRYALAMGADPAAVRLVPDTLTIDGAFGVRTAMVAHAVLLLNFGQAAATAGDHTPANASGVALWFQREVAPLAPPTGGEWSIWNSVQHISNAALTGDAVAQVALAYWQGTTAAGVDITTPTPSTTTPTPNTDPGTGTAPVPGGLPTVRQPSPVTITAQKAKMPVWVFWTGGAIAVGALLGVGYYYTKHRPDLFKSRAKRRR